MKKKQAKRQTQAKKEEKPVTLGDMINQDVMARLNEAKQKLKEDEERQRLQEEFRKKEERRLKEKNKSFEELLSESGLDWKKFK
ncbi:YqkE family protein [Bacillus sp. T33-2]|uniref:YqkE family protein n=1 Tax=Bacillus sp. T33-2 TaxID=2054168 RepID=UPI000C77E935|nr:YqkE family protein [Bacillus sp. T33-2]PLR99825.1 DUF3886 domain-containing protein [Bacillus sp. T33-2]